MFTELWSRAFLLTLQNLVLQGTTERKKIRIFRLTQEKTVSGY